MGAETTLKRIPPDQRVRFIQAVVGNLAEPLVVKINGRISELMTDTYTLPHRIKDHHFVTTAPLGSSEEERRRIFEKKMSPALQVPLEAYDGAEEIRMRNGMARQQTLKTLGFAPDSGTTSYIFTGKGRRVKGITFTVMQSPNLTSFFLIFTSKPSLNDPSLVELSEDLLFVPNIDHDNPDPRKTFNKAAEYWKKTVRKKRATAQVQ